MFVLVRPGRMSGRRWAEQAPRLPSLQRRGAVLGTGWHCLQHDASASLSLLQDAQGWAGNRTHARPPSPPDHPPAPPPHPLSLRPPLPTRPPALPSHRTSSRSSRWPWVSLRPSAAALTPVHAPPRAPPLAPRLQHTTSPAVTSPCAAPPPHASVLGDVTEDLALRYGSVIGGLINVSGPAHAPHVLQGTLARRGSRAAARWCTRLPPYRLSHGFAWAGACKRGLDQQPVGGLDRAAKARRAAACVALCGAGRQSWTDGAAAPCPVPPLDLCRPRSVRGDGGCAGRAGAGCAAGAGGCEAELARSGVRVAAPAPALQLSPPHHQRC